MLRLAGERGTCLKGAARLRPYKATRPDWDAQGDWVAGNFELDAAARRADVSAVTPQEKVQAIEAARAAGIDLEMIDSNLELSPEQRALRHESALELALALREAGRVIYAKSALVDSATR